MILRRLTKHVKDQNWFAVALDFCIVVAGVFIGLQVSNWNERRADRVAERELLVRVERDVAAAIDLKSAWLSDMETHRSHLLEAVGIVQNQPAEKAIDDAQCEAMWSSHLVFYPEVTLSALDDLLAKGSPLTPLAQRVQPILLAYRARHEEIQQLNTSLSGLANLGDTYSDVFPRHVVTQTRLAEATNGRATRITDSTFGTSCHLEEIRANQAIQNKLLSNLARTDGLLQRVKLDVSLLEQINNTLGRHKS